MWNLSENSILHGSNYINDFVLNKKEWLSIGQDFMLKNQTVEYGDSIDIEEDPEGKRLFKSFGIRPAKVTEFCLGQEKKAVQEFIETFGENIYTDSIEEVPIICFNHYSYIDLLTLLIVEDSLEGKGEWFDVYYDKPRPFGDLHYLLFMDGDKILANVSCRSGE